MKLLEKLEITPDTLGLLMFIKLNTSPTEYVSKIIKEYVFDFKLMDTEYSFADVFEKKGWIKYVKTGKKDPHHRIRLSKDGEEILKSLNQKPIHELAQFALDYTKEEYSRIGANSLIKGGDKLLHYVSEWLYFKENYTDRMVKAVISAYVNQFEYDNKYMNNMGTLFFKPTNAYATKWKCEDSPICNFIEKNKDAIKQVYNKLCK